jgi:hypothetical protein
VDGHRTSVERSARRDGRLLQDQPDDAIGRLFGDEHGNVRTERVAHERHAVDAGGVQLAQHMIAKGDQRVPAGHGSAHVTQKRQRENVAVKPLETASEDLPGRGSAGCSMKADDPFHPANLARAVASPVPALAPRLARDTVGSS